MEQLTQALLKHLAEAGIQGQKRFPVGPMPKLQQPCAAVEVQSLRSQKSGLGDYLGLVERQGKEPAECYGKRVEGTALIRIFAPTAAMAQDACAAAMQALSGGCEGIFAETLSLEETRYDAHCDLYVRDMLLQFSAYFYILSSQEEQVFYDFKLEGEIQ